MRSHSDPNALQSGPPSAPPRKTARLVSIVGALLLLAGGVVAVCIILFTSERTPEGTPDGGLVLPGSDGKKPAAAVDPRLKLVEPAIEKGVAYLRGALKNKERWSDGRIAHASYAIAALVGLTLLECGAAPDDPDVLAIAKYVREGAPRSGHTYVISCCLFFFNRWDRAQPLNADDRKLARSLGLRLCAGQNALGVWAYVCPILNAKEEEDLLARLKKDDPPPGKKTFFSISNSQFAMLALWGARKHGVPVRETLLRAAEHFHVSQFPDGHWIYNVEGTPHALWTTATAAGLMALAMDRALREDPEFNPSGKDVKDPRKRADVAKAFEYVAKSIGRKKGDPGGATHMYAGTIFQADAWGDLYYLWTIERLGMIYGMPEIGGKDWYEWGYPIVLEKQKADGSWQDRHQVEVDTCFALLFLRRANLAQDLSDKLRGLARWGGRSERRILRDDGWRV